MNRERPLLLFAPGAGAPSSSAWMQGWARRLETLGSVESFDYPYQIAGRASPDRQPVLIAAHRAALERAREHHGGPFAFLGKSMGGRMGCHLAVELAREEAAGSPQRSPAALVCFGYPLVGQGGQLRDEVLYRLARPVLFVQGTRDRLCPLERLETVRARMQAPNELYVVEGGDHSLVVGKRELASRGQRQDDVDSDTEDAIEGFLARAFAQRPQVSL